jgi:hypothetical protein
LDSPGQREFDQLSSLTQRLIRFMDAMFAPQSAEALFKLSTAEEEAMLAEHVRSFHHFMKSDRRLPPPNDKSKLEANEKIVNESPESSFPSFGALFVWYCILARPTLYYKHFGGRVGVAGFPKFLARFLERESAGFIETTSVFRLFVVLSFSFIIIICYAYQLLVFNSRIRVRSGCH